MDMTIKTPVQIFINGRFFCIASEAEIKRRDPRFKKSLIPDNVKLQPGEWTGTVINIKRPLRTKEEKEAVRKILKAEPYDEFYTRMVKAKSKHIPVELDAVQFTKERGER